MSTPSSVLNEKVAEAARRLHPGVATFDPMTIVLLLSIITAAMRMIAACRDLQRAKTPGFFGRWRLWWVVKAECAKWNVDPRPVFDAVIEVGRTASNRDLVMALREVTGEVGV